MSRFLITVFGLTSAAAMAQEPAPRPFTPLPKADIQINVAGGGSILTTVPTPDGRRLTMRDGSETIELQERNGGKDIVLKHERMVNGAPKRNDYKAPDLDTLKKQHPDAADLYRRIITRANVQPALPPPIRINGANGMPQFVFPGRQSPQPGEGQRRLTAFLAGQQIKIEDRYGAQIEISVTRTVDGRSQTETHTAADLATLTNERPELAAVYRRLTGLN